MIPAEQCMYCSGDSRLTDLMIPICELEMSSVYLFKEQTYHGRCVVAFNRGHRNELFELTDAERNAFMRDVSRAASAVHTAFSPHKINYGAYGDKMPHVHFHIVPKYESAPNWGSTFDMMPESRKFLTEETYTEVIDAIRMQLQG